ncbi:DAK2 domain-containing protein [Geosporobacter ferrireducens]|uniref:DAK2 domain-containing protein n=1 Tax=Geosporobacter ferrireducens TaxID=1424294 RepID=UPI00139DC3E6|nr:DAK2 domain-containing protein [Geosporobacter ferrireducens]
MKIKYIDGPLLKKMMIQAANSLENNKSTVDALNVFPVPDGDTGTNMALTMNSAAKEIKNIKDESVESVSEAAANGSLMGARGNSGVILSQLFRGFSKACKGKNKLNTVDLANALKSASDTAYKAVMKPIEGTILTVAREIGEKAIEISKKEEDLESFLWQIIEYAEKVLDKTPDLLKVLKQAGVVDAGGKGLIYIYKGFYGALTGKEMEISETAPLNTVEFHSDVELGEITFGYCTEFIIKGSRIDIEDFKKKIGTYGDCMLVVGDESLAKVHIHTNNPGSVLEHGLKLGELISIKIDNMRQQHRNQIFEEEKPQETQPLKAYGMIAVTMGEGLTNIFKDLNVDEIITGGQTMNPSTEEIKKSIDAISAKNIFIFPNNSNIILAANQAKQLSDKHVIVIPTKSVPQGIAAILSFNGETDPETNEKTMSDALKNVKTGQVTFSVRDTQFNDIDIKKDDILGIYDGNIKAVGTGVAEVSMSLLKEMITDEDEILTIFYGEEQSESSAQALADTIGKKYKDIDIEVYYGGQPLYHYIFSVE